MKFLTLIGLMLLCWTATAQAGESRSFIYDSDYRLIAATETYGACKASIFINYKSPQKTSFLVMLRTPADNVAYILQATLSDTQGMGLGESTKAGLFKIFS